MREREGNHSRAAGDEGNNHMMLERQPHVVEAAAIQFNHQVFAWLPWKHPPEGTRSEVTNGDTAGVLCRCTETLFYHYSTPYSTVRALP